MSRAIAIVSFALIGFAARAQTTSAPLAFEVASVKESQPLGFGPVRIGISGGPGTADPGRITCVNMTLRDLLILAYGVKSHQLSGPGWLEHARFDIVAAVPARATTGQVQQMWLTLLGERFQIKVHRESKELPVFAMTVGKSGLKIEKAASEDEKSDSAKPPAGRGPAPNPGITSGMAKSAVPTGAPSGGTGMAHINHPSMTMSNLADTLTHVVDRPVIDETGLTARYVIHLEWQADDAAGVTQDTAGGQNIPSALQSQLGLRLESRKAKIDFIVIDHAEQTPVAN